MDGRGVPEEGVVGRGFIGRMDEMGEMDEMGGVEDIGYMGEMDEMEEMGVTGEDLSAQILSWAGFVWAGFVWCEGLSQGMY